MKTEEFDNEFKRLKEAFPQHFSSKSRQELIARAVAILDAKWWRALVDRMILANDPRMDIDYAARSERIARSSIRLAKETSQAWDALNNNMTEAGFQSALGQFGAKNLWEAIEKNKQK